jgi:DNA-binding MarR family transcriptional regulator
MKRPANADLRLGPATLRVLARVLSGQRLLRGLARDLGVSPPAVIQSLKKLRDAGLVSQEPRRHATIVPLCRFVPANELES